jgi:TonB-dependent SusC/RagA subfamily outer membrane receptor
MKTVIGLCFLLVSVLSAQAQKSSDGGQPVYKSIYEMLRNVPGLEVTINAKGAGSVIVRGAGSLTRQTAPLYVVDGVIFTGDISSINPNEVYQISVLKDAASTTAYGAQGAAGVIQIVMKKGSTVSNQPAPAPVVTHTESAYTYFIEHKTKLKVIGLDDNVIIEGVIQEQRGESLVFKKKKTEQLVPIKDIKRVEMLPANE